MRRLIRATVIISLLSALSFGQANNLNALKKQALEKVDARQQLVQQMVDQIFSYAELGFQEVETSNYVTGILEKNGFKVERGVAGIPGMGGDLWVRQAGDWLHHRHRLHSARIAEAGRGLPRTDD